MSTTGIDALLAVYATLAPEEQDAAYEHITETRLAQGQVADRELALHVRSLRRVREVVGHVPGVDEYRHVSRRLIAEGEDVQTFARLYKFFDCSWSQAREALLLSGDTSTRAIEARFQNRRIGRISRYSEDVLQATIDRAVKHYGRPPSVMEFAWWRDREIELARAQGDEHPNIPSDSCYRSRWKTWEAALLHHGYTPEQVALRLEQRSQVFNANADPYLPDDLPVAELAFEIPESLPLSRQEAERVRDCYEVMPRRTRYVLTVRLGLGVEKQTLRETAEPMALHLTRIQQIQLYALDALLQGASDGRKETRPGLRADIIAGLRAMSS